MNSPQTAPGRSYRRVVWDRFRRDRLAMSGLCLVGFLFLVAFLAPFLANNKPLLLSLDGRLSSPMLREFFAPLENPEAMLERIFNFLCSLLVLTILLGLPVLLGLRLAGRRPTRRVTLVGLLVLGVLALVPFAFVRPRLDKTEYRSLVMSASEKGNAWAVWAPIRFGPFEQPAKPYQAPDATHLMGTDKVGRDVLSRLIHGSRVSLSVGFLSVGVAVLIGTVVGATAAYYGRWVDIVISRFIEIVICFPTFLLILTIIAFLDKRSIFNIMLVIGLTGWTGVARLVRGEMLRQKQMDYVTSARALGIGDAWIIFRHLVPNSIAPVLVAATFGVAGAILTETGLSFLGFGVQMPTASWGELVNQAKAWPAGYWWLTTWPGFMIFLTVTIYNLVGEGLRDALDPRLRI